MSLFPRTASRRSRSWTAWSEPFALPLADLPSPELAPCRVDAADPHEGAPAVLHITGVGAANSTAAQATARTSQTAGDGTWNTHPGNVARVRFEPGARTHWHAHEGGRLLYVVEGEGWVQSRGEDARSVGPGDAVSIAPAEVHWHGAKSNGVMAHVAVTTGRPTWLEESQAPAG